MLNSITSLISNRRIQKNITKDINCIRHLNRERSIKELLLKIEEYYVEKHYSEDVLFKRSSELRTMFVFSDSIYTGAIGGFIALMLGYLDIWGKLGNMNIVAKLLIMVIFIGSIVLAVALILTALTKFSYSSKKMYDDYISRKQIEMIERLLEGEKELT